MKKLILIICLMTSALSIKAQEKDFPKLNGPYLGQKAPGTTPQIFAKGIVSTDGHEFSCCFSPEGKEFYYAARDAKTRQTAVMVCRLVDGKWTIPEREPALLSEGFTFEPFVTPDNRRLYFQTAGVVNGKPEMMTKYVERNEKDWSEIKDPGAPFNPGKTMHISSTANGTIYTTDISGGMGSESLGIIKIVNGQYEKLEKLGTPFNKESNQQHPWVSPDESYLIFTLRKPGQSPSSVLFCSFKNKVGKWTEPVEIKLGMEAGQPYVTYDGKYLFSLRAIQRSVRISTGSPQKSSKS